MVVLVAADKLDWFDEDFDRTCCLPSDIVSFANQYFPLNPDPKRPLLGPDLPPVTADWVRHLDNGKSGGIVGPPGFLKTASMERYFLWRISQDRELTAAYITRTDGKAKEFVRVIKNRLEGNVLTRDYGEFKDTEIWGSEKFRVIRKNDSKDPTLQGIGIGGQLESARLNLAMLDDLSDFRSYHSLAERKLVRDWIDLTLIPRMDPGAIIVFIGSRWHPQDYITHLRAMPIFKGGIIEIKAIKSDGTSYCEDIYPIAELDEKRESIGPTMFDLRYQATAAEAGKLPFQTPRTCDLMYIMRVGIYKRFAAIDFNASKKESSDMTALSFLTLLKNGEWVYDSCFSDHLARGYEDFIGRGIEQSRRYGFPDPKPGVWAEAINFQYALGSYIDKEMKLPIDIIPIPQHQKSDRTDMLDLDYIDKYNRIISVLQGPIDSGKLMVYQDKASPRPGTADLITFFTNFPEIEFYDHLDACQMVYRMARPYWNNQGPRPRRASAGY